MSSSLIFFSRFIASSFCLNSLSIASCFSLFSRPIASTFIYSICSLSSKFADFSSPLSPCSATSFCRISWISTVSSARASLNSSRPFFGGRGPVQDLYNTLTFFLELRRKPLSHEGYQRHAAHFHCDGVP